MIIYREEDMEIKDTYRVDIVVQDCDTALAHKSGGLPVYATPAMIAMIAITTINSTSEKPLFDFILKISFKKYFLPFAR